MHELNTMEDAQDIDDMDVAHFPIRNGVVRIYDAQPAMSEHEVFDAKDCPAHKTLVWFDDQYDNAYMRIFDAKKGNYSYFRLFLAEAFNPGSWWKLRTFKRKIKGKDGDVSPPYGWYRVKNAEMAHFIHDRFSSIYLNDIREANHKFPLKMRDGRTIQPKLPRDKWPFTPTYRFETVDGKTYRVPLFSLRAYTEEQNRYHFQSLPAALRPGPGIDSKFGSVEEGLITRQTIYTIFALLDRQIDIKVIHLARRSGPPTFEVVNASEGGICYLVRGEGKDEADKMMIRTADEAGNMKERVFFEIDVPIFFRRKSRPQFSIKHKPNAGMTKVKVAQNTSADIATLMAMVTELLDRIQETRLKPTESDIIDFFNEDQERALQIYDIVMKPSQR